jgi:hypothetical protein
VHAATTPDPGSRADSLKATIDSALARDSIRRAATDSVPVAPVTHAVVTDSGGLRLTNLPRGSTVMIDSRPLTDPEARLPVGPHELAITAPRYNFYLDTVDITLGQVLVLTPELVPIGAPAPPKPAPAALDCTVPSPANRFGRACYDKPPLPAGPARVPLTDQVSGTPSPSVLLVKVSADGRTLIVQPNTPSNDPAFQSLAVTFAKNLKWHPAVKNGTPVEGWTQFAFYPEH